MLMEAQFGLVTTILLGQVMLGGVMSDRTETVKQQKPTAPAGAVLVQQTVVTPGGKRLPEGGLQARADSSPVQTLMT